MTVLCLYTCNVNGYSAWCCNCDAYIWRYAFTFRGVLYLYVFLMFSWCLYKFPQNWLLAHVSCARGLTVFQKLLFRRVCRFSCWWYVLYSMLSHIVSVQCLSEMEGMPAHWVDMKLRCRIDTSYCTTAHYPAPGTPGVKFEAHCHLGTTHNIHNGLILLGHSWHISNTGPHDQQQTWYMLESQRQALKQSTRDSTWNLRFVGSIPIASLDDIKLFLVFSREHEWLLTMHKKGNTCAHM